MQISVCNILHYFIIKSLFHSWENVLMGVFSTDTNCSLRTLEGGGIKCQKGL